MTQSRKDTGPRLGEGELPTIPDTRTWLYVPQVASKAAQDQLRKALTWVCEVAYHDDILAETLTFRMARYIVILGWLHGRRDSPFAADYTPFAVDMACRLARKFLDR